MTIRLWEVELMDDPVESGCGGRCRLEHVEMAGGLRREPGNCLPRGVWGGPGKVASGNCFWWGGGQECEHLGRGQGRFPVPSLSPSQWKYCSTSVDLKEVGLIPSPAVGALDLQMPLGDNSDAGFTGGPVEESGWVRKTPGYISCICTACHVEKVLKQRGARLSAASQDSGWVLSFCSHLTRWLLSSLFS